MQKYDIEFAFFRKTIALSEVAQEKFESRLLDEKLVAEAELNAVAVLSRAVAQKAANAGMEILQKAVDTAIAAAL